MCVRVQQHVLADVIGVKRSIPREYTAGCCCWLLDHNSARVAVAAGAGADAEEKAKEQSQKAAACNTNDRLFYTSTKLI